MRGVVAKRIRREIYGDLSLRGPRPLMATSRNKTTGFNDPASPRARYQAAKRAHRSGR